MTGSRSALGLACALGLGGLLLGAPSAEAQVPFTAIGLGYPIRSLDARSLGLGGVATGLLNGTSSLANPADLTLHDSPVVSVSVAAEDIDLKHDSGSQNTGRSWFPVIDAVIPLEDWALRVGFGGLLDQDLKVILTDTLSTSFGRFEFEELRTRDGGLSQIDISAARRLGPFSVGFGVQRLTGSLRQTLRRRFTVDVDSTGSLPAPVLEGSRTDYGGWAFQAGANATFADRILVSGSFFWATDLRAKESEDLFERTFELPNGFELGASGRLSQRLMLTAGAGFSGWSDTASPFVGAEAVDVTWLGGGLEYSTFLGAMPLALRVGGRTRDLPFRLPGRAQPREQAITFGFGALFSGRARFDLGFEVGSRGDLETADVEESFLAGSFTFSISQ